METKSEVVDGKKHEQLEFEITLPLLLKPEDLQDLDILVAAFREFEDVAGERSYADMTREKLFQLIFRLGVYNDFRRKLDFFAANVGVTLPGKEGSPV